MSPFELSSEHETFRKSVREFAEGEIAPHAAQWDKDHHFPTDVVQNCLLYTSPSPRDKRQSRMPSSA